jgi:hypothetical protein
VRADTAPLGVPFPMFLRPALFAAASAGLLLAACATPPADRVKIG